VPGYEVRLWHGVAAPKDTPADVIARLNDAVKAGLADPEMNKRLADIGAVPMPMSPAEHGKFIAEDAAKWGRVVKFSGLKPD
jgi:tripartite-type tricarboxylate transporter receptor subunit TctC